MPNQITPEILRQIMPTLPKAKRELYAPMLESSMSEFGINNERRVAAYLANLAHESRNLTRWEEGLNYRAKRLTEVWPNRFPNLSAAAPYANNPEALANRTYGGRMGNNSSGDGWKYRGRFPLQLTGKDMYRKASKALNTPELLTDPDSCMSDPTIGFRASAWVFAKEKGGNQFADKQQIKALTKAINGGYHGLAERIELYNRGLRVLPDNFQLGNGSIHIESDEEAPDFMDSDVEEQPSDSEQVIDSEKGVTTSDKPVDETEGTPPPTPAVEVKPSQSSLLSKATALSLPTGAIGILAGIWNFVKDVPPWAWAILGGIFIVTLIVAAWLYNESQKRANQRTLMLGDAAADKDKNNLRLV